MKKIFAIGEALIDFIPSQKGCALKEVVSFERVAGGAPANVCGAIAKLGGHVGFISQLGEDAFGEFIIDELNEVGVDTTHILRTKVANTGLAFVSLKEDGNRDFSFYRNPSADLLLSADQIEREWFKDCYGLHFCSVDLVESPMKGAHQKAIEYVLDEGGLISFDPNVRLPLWSSPEACRTAILEFLPFAHVIKISDEELEFITGETNIAVAQEKLFTGNVEMIIYTKGGEGAEVFTKTKHVTIPGNVVKVMDTTGAGDSFIGSFLYELGRDHVSVNDIKSLSEETLREYLSFANDYAGYSTLGKGAIASYATLEEITKFRSEK
nr:carbohydrate kinase [uncultured Cellulosilyticum sp.]